MTLDGNYRGFEIATRDPGIAVITFNDRTASMGSRGMKRDLTEIMSQAQLDADTASSCITGSGRASAPVTTSSTRRRTTVTSPRWFHHKCATSGTHRSTSTPSSTAYSQELIRSILNLDKITIAALNGVGDPDRVVDRAGVRLPHRLDRCTPRQRDLRFGFLPDEGGHWILLRHLGLARALEFLMRKQIVSAEEALDLGLVTEVVDPEQLMPRAIDLAEEMANGPQVAMRMLKRSLHNATGQTSNRPATTSRPRPR